MVHSPPRNCFFSYNSLFSYTLCLSLYSDLNKTPFLVLAPIRPIFTPTQNRRSILGPRIIQIEDLTRVRHALDTVHAGQILQAREEE
jgi:hypothetical protein